MSDERGGETGREREREREPTVLSHVLCDAAREFPRDHRWVPRVLVVSSSCFLRQKALGDLKNLPLLNLEMKRDGGGHSK